VARNRQPEFVTITVARVLSETDKAFLIHARDPEDEIIEIWLAKSNMEDPTALEMGDVNEDVAVAHWWARNEGLSED